MVDIAIEKVIPGIIAIIIIFALGYYGFKQVPGLSKSLLGYDPFDKTIEEETKLAPEIKSNIFNTFFTELENCYQSPDKECRCKVSPNPTQSGYFLSFERGGIGLHQGKVERSLLKGLSALKTERTPTIKALPANYLTPKVPEDSYISSDLKNYFSENEFYITYEDGNTIVKTRIDRPVVDYLFGGVYKKDKNLYFLSQGTSLSSKPLCSEPPQNQTQPIV